MYLFIYFSWLISLVNFFVSFLVLCWIKVLRVGFFVFILISHLLLSMMLAVGFSHIVFTILRSVLSISTYHNERIMSFVKCFSIFTEMIIWFLYFSMLMWYITFIDLHILNHSCISTINPTWSWLWDPFNILDSFCKYFVEEICIYVH